MNRTTACEVYRRLLLQYPVVDGRRHFLDFHNPYETLILTILSAQTTDRAVNAVRDALFSRYPTPEALARAEPGEVEPIIRTIGFHRTKARHIVGAARKIVAEFGGEVPRTMEELRSLPPGVGGRPRTSSSPRRSTSTSASRSTPTSAGSRRGWGSPRARTPPTSSSAISWLSSPPRRPGGGHQLSPDPPRPGRLHGAEPEARGVRRRGPLPVLPGTGGAGRSRANYSGSRLRGAQQVAGSIRCALNCCFLGFLQSPSTDFSAAGLLVTDSASVSVLANLAI
ncbi:hypothetical protein [Methanoculleus chikugoensis]|uniref:endonuclease III domain-containing protein n=1 Tax=Methanoculleus chikugoensis TaxID=118126 RepID=UPI000AC70F71|nr:hypothetical protein [Methanoculleus chikugoensis]